jgi:hypothetical protein
MYKDGRLSPVVEENPILRDTLNLHYPLTCVDLARLRLKASLSTPCSSRQQYQHTRMKVLAFCKRSQYSSVSSLRYCPRRTRLPCTERERRRLRRYETGISTQRPTTTSPWRSRIHSDSIRGIPITQATVPPLPLPSTTTTFLPRLPTIISTLIIPYGLPTLRNVSLQRHRRRRIAPSNVSSVIRASPEMRFYKATYANTMAKSPSNVLHVERLSGARMSVRGI